MILSFFFNPICPKTLCSLSPIPMTLHIKFDQDWPTGFRDIQVQRCEIFGHSRASNSKMNGLSRPKIELNRDFMPVLVTSNFDDEIFCISSLPTSIKRIGSKTTEKRWRQNFPQYKSMGAFCCHGHQSFDPICLKTLGSLSPPH